MSEVILIPAGESAALLPSSSAFAYGFGLFETMHYAEGQLGFWRDHWARLSVSARHFALLMPKEDAVLAALRELVVESNLEQSEAVLKMSLLKDGDRSRLYVYSRPPLPVPDGRTLLLDTSAPIFPRSLLAGHKTHNYMESMHLLGLARAQGYYDALRVDSEGNLAETTTANLFFIRGERVYTPALDSGILPGVARAAILRAPELEVEEGAYSPADLLEADAVCVTSATQGAQAIDAVVGFTDGAQGRFDGENERLSAIRSVLVRARADRAESLI